MAAADSPATGRGELDAQFDDLESSLGDGFNPARVHTSKASRADTVFKMLPVSLFGAVATLGIDAGPGLVGTIVLVMAVVFAVGAVIWDHRRVTDVEHDRYRWSE